MSTVTSKVWSALMDRNCSCWWTKKRENEWLRTERDKLCPIHGDSI